jgi:hypothetical protein
VNAQDSLAYGKTITTHPSFDLWRNKGLTSSQRFGQQSRTDPHQRVIVQDFQDVYDLLQIQSLLHGNRQQNYLKLRGDEAYQLLTEGSEQEGVESGVEPNQPPSLLASAIDPDADSTGAQNVRQFFDPSISQYGISALRNHPLVNVPTADIDSLFEASRRVVEQVYAANTELDFKIIHGSHPTLNSDQQPRRMAAVNKAVENILWQINDLANIGFKNGRGELGVTISAEWFPATEPENSWYAFVTTDQEAGRRIGRATLWTSYSLTFNYGVVFDFIDGEEIDDALFDDKAEQLVIAAHAALMYLAAQHTIHQLILTKVISDLKFSLGLTGNLERDGQRAVQVAHATEELVGGQSMYGSLDFATLVKLASHLSVARHTNLVGLPAQSDENGGLSVDTILKLSGVLAARTLARAHYRPMTTYNSYNQTVKDIIRTATDGDEMPLEQQHWSLTPDGIPMPRQNGHTMIALLRQEDQPIATATALILETFSVSDLVAKRALKIGEQY